jgi:AAT family amino acid transporter
VASPDTRAQFLSMAALTAAIALIGGVARRLRAQRAGQGAQLPVGAASAAT